MFIVLFCIFLQSEWCMLEFCIVYYKVLEDCFKLIVILFDDVILDELDGEIKLYLCINIYFSIKDKWFWEKLIYVMQSNKKEKFGNFFCKQNNVYIIILLFLGVMKKNIFYVRIKIYYKKEDDKKERNII